MKPREGLSSDLREMPRGYTVALDRIRIDRTHDVGSIDPVNPVYIDKVEQIGGDWNRRRRFHQPRSGLAFRATRKIDRQPEVKSWRTISYPAPLTMSRNRATL